MMEKREAATKLGEWLDKQTASDDLIGDMLEGGYVSIDERADFSLTDTGEKLLKEFNPAFYKRYFINPKMGKNKKVNGSHVIMRDGHFVWTGGFATRDIPKQAGFLWDKEKKYWWTGDPAKARQLFDFADYDAQVEMGSPKIPEGIGKYKEIVLEGIQYLADRCDWAQDLDYMGYSKGTTSLGHSLAAKTTLTAEQAALALPLLSLHRHQLPGHILDTLKPFFAIERNN